MNEARLAELLERYFERELAEEEKGELEAMLLASDAARARFWEVTEWHALFRQWGEEESGREAAVGGDRIVPMPARKSATPWWMWPLAAAAVFFAVFIVTKSLSPRGGEPPGARVALLARAVAVEWEDAARQPGESLAPGWLRLKSGAVQIEFARGARVVLEGPAEFRLVSDNEGFLRRGKLRAVVPEPAHGFTIRGEGFSVVDRGTEFGCIVGDAAEVHVLAGTVAVKVSTTERTLAKAEAVRFSSGKMETITARPELFLSDEKLAQMAASDAGARLAAWRTASAALSAHPAALVHYDFEQTHTLTNRAPSDVTANIVGCEPAQGRWPGKGALEFKRAEDRVRFTVPGEMPSLTLLAWVRVDALPNIQSSLLMSESERAGDVHWYLHRDLGVGFAVIAPDGRWRSVRTPVVLRREVFGTWLFLAVTFDGATGVATHYFNGQPVASGALDAGGPLRLHTVEIGNWGLRPGAPLLASKRVAEEPGGYVRNLQGRIDEFAILSVPLSAPEILRLYESGRPTASPTFSK